MLAVSDQPLEDLGLEIADPTAGPRVARYLSGELSHILDAIRADPSTTQYQVGQVAPRAEALLAATEPMTRLSATAGWLAPLATVRLWGGVLVALMPGRQAGGVSGTWEQLATYPACLVAYSLGMGASAARRYDVLAWIFAAPLPNERNEWRPLIEMIHPYTINERVGPHLRDVKFQPSPLSDHLHTVIRPFFGDLLPRDEHFEREFDRFELLGGLAHYHLSGATGAEAWVPLGRALRLGRYVDNAAHKILTDEGASSDAAPELLRLMGCDSAATDETIKGFHAAVGKQLSQALFWR